MQNFQGSLQKLKGFIDNSNEDLPIHYFLPMENILSEEDKQDIPLNPLLGKIITLSFEGAIHCIACKQKIKKSYQQGYCFPCTQKLAACDICIVRPEKCHFSQGTCREPDWAKTHCFTPHIIYLANTSQLKVGITRKINLPTRWIDQGASQGLPIAEVQHRHQAGIIETTLASLMPDKTNWRKMLQGEPEFIDLLAIQEKFRQEISDHIQPLNQAIQILKYPVLSYPSKITSHSLEKNNKITGTLLGIKGQYLILDIGVINIRAHTGFVVNFSVED